MSLRLKLDFGGARGPDSVCSRTAPPFLWPGLLQDTLQTVLPVRAIVTMRMSIASSLVPGAQQLSQNRLPSSGTIHPAGLWLTQGLPLSRMIIKNAKCTWNGREQRGTDSVPAGTHLFVTAYPSLPHGRACSLG